MSSSVDVNNKNKDISILGKRQKKKEKKVLDNTSLTAEAEYLINFSRSEIKYCLSLHYNESNSFSFLNTIKIHQFKAKDSKDSKDTPWV